MFTSVCIGVWEVIHSHSTTPRGQYLIPQHGDGIEYPSLAQGLPPHHATGPLEERVEPDWVSGRALSCTIIISDMHVCLSYLYSGSDQTLD